MSLRIGRKVLAVSLTAALTACGGGGGTGPAPLSAATLQGLYLFVGANGWVDAGAAQGGGITGKATADGIGALSVAAWENAMGVIDPPSTTPYIYTVMTDGTLSLELPFPFPFDFEILRGGVSSDGRFALAGVVADEIDPAIVALLRRGGSYDATSLTGAYHSVFFGTDVASTNSFSIAGPANLDGVSMGTAAGLTRNTMGTISASSFSFDYTVWIDGSAIVSESTSGETLEGAVVGGADVAMFGGAISPAGAIPAMLVLVRGAGAASEATFAGEYWFVALSRNPTGAGFRSLSGSAVADGLGGVTLQSISDTERVVAVEPLFTTGYTVAPDGTFSLASAGGTLLGGITADGSFAALGGATTPGSPPTIWLLCRK